MKSFRIAVVWIAFAGVTVPAAAQYLSQGDEFVEAVRSRDGNKVTELLQAHPNLVDTKDEKGDTALIIALSRSDEDFTAFLLNKGADPNAAGRGGDTPLIAAARVGYEEGVEWLLSQGAKVDMPNRQGETALIVAVQQRQAPIVKLLLASGADPDKTDNAAGLSARAYAARDPRARDILNLIQAKKPKAVPSAGSR